MKLLDTCVWIEIILGGPMGQAFKPLYLDKQNIILPSLVQFELRRWALRQYSEATVDQITLTLRETKLVETNERMALLAADLATAHKLHAMDALIYATALEHDAELVTCDAHFKDLPQVDYTPKSK
jgi:predicted nucleic acid-binding protein